MNVPGSFSDIIVIQQFSGFIFWVVYRRQRSSGQGKKFGFCVYCITSPQNSDGPPSGLGADGGIGSRGVEEKNRKWRRNKVRKRRVGDREECQERKKNLEGKDEERRNKIASLPLSISGLLSTT
ncbi:hypothetical protein PoB_001625700 [Plakobranchus ocellatus]|uniref:Uncharacterized protein n=1 Tax=Plakobranchus ocellatus TaxID=259542 RepID=A0AAV3Z5C9_9GAST|nr:hypothetical protein PoB_001625700 [Plakobranchus ocellatus]